MAYGDTASSNDEVGLATAVEIRSACYPANIDVNPALAMSWTSGWI